jgi:anaerobic ribonucleoside-triphosphate reductase
MLIEYSYNKEFIEDFNRLRRNKNFETLLNLDGIGWQLDIHKFSKNFYKKSNTADVSIDSNANIDEKTIVQYENELVKPILKMNSYYLLWKHIKKLYDRNTAREILEAQFFKDFYINDMTSFGTKSYCFNFSCVDIMTYGLPFVKKIKTKPAKHLTSFLGHIISFVTYACNQIVGAVGLADLLICCSKFTKDLDEDTIKQELQAIIYQFNQPFRSSVQSPFVNVSIFDDIFLKKLCNEYTFPDFTKPDIKEVKRLQEIFIDLMNATLERTAFTFPVTTACFAVDDDKNILDKKFLNFISEKNRKFCFINIYAGKTSTLSSCCRLRSNQDKVYGNSTFGVGTKIGSASVCTLNLPRIAYVSNNEEEFLAYIQYRTELIFKTNHARRDIVQERIDNKNYPLYNLNFMDLRQQYSTCGFVGLYECCEIMKKDPLSEEGKEFIYKILETINLVNDELEKQTKIPTNMEQTPSENSAIVIAKADKILGYNKKYQLYSNQFIPLTYESDIANRIELQGSFDEHMTGGAILHINIVDQITDEKYLAKLIEYCVKKGVIYHAINYNLQQCKNEHIVVGKNEKCPICNSSIVENFTRVVGFLVPVSNWHKIRREKDYNERQFYSND